MKKYIKPQAYVLNFCMEQMIATSPGLKDELGDGDQLSNERSEWDAPEWSEEN